MNLDSVMSQFELRAKNKPKLIHLPIFAFMGLVSLVRRDFSFFTKYVNILGNTLYMPQNILDLVRHNPNNYEGLMSTP